nr:hypothetical protein [uncultured Mogibacterium sp.]
MRMQGGYLLNVNDVKEIVKEVNLTRMHDDCLKRRIEAKIELQTTAGRYTFIEMFKFAPLKEGEQWGYGTKGGKRAVERIEDILDTMITILVDKMNEKDEKIISIGTNFLEEAMQAEVDRG